MPKQRKALWSLEAVLKTMQAPFEVVQTVDAWRPMQTPHTLNAVQLPSIALQLPDLLQQQIGEECRVTHAEDAISQSVVGSKGPISNNSLQRAQLW